jgi:hypothetical protein
MRLRVPRPAAWFARTVLLPRMLAAERFPRGAEAPAEVRPDLARARAFDQPEMRAHLCAVAEAAARALRDADEQRPAVRVTHAYFGPLRSLAALRLLSAHTRHHAAGVERRGAAGWPA